MQKAQWCNGVNGEAIAAATIAAATKPAEWVPWYDGGTT